MGKHFGMMYQLVDDYLDKDDDPYAILCITTWY